MNTKFMPTYQYIRSKNVLIYWCKVEVAKPGLVKYLRFFVASSKMYEIWGFYDVEFHFRIFA